MRWRVRDSWVDAFKEIAGCVKRQHQKKQSTQHLGQAGDRQVHTDVGVCWGTLKIRELEGTISLPHPQHKHRDTCGKWYSRHFHPNLLAACYTQEFSGGLAHSKLLGPGLRANFVTASCALCPAAEGTAATVHCM